MVHHYYRNVHAVVFVYDVTNLLSFEVNILSNKSCKITTAYIIFFQSLPHWIEECNDHRLTNQIPRILVGNKFDCAEQQAVHTNRAQMFADVHNMPLFETSAKDDGKADHVESIFMTLAHKLKNSKPMMPVHMSMWESDRDHFISDGSVHIGTRNLVCRPVTNDSCSC